MAEDECNHLAATGRAIPIATILGAFATIERCMDTIEDKWIALLSRVGALEQQVPTFATRTDVDSLRKVLMEHLDRAGDAQG